MFLGLGMLKPHRPEKRDEFGIVNIEVPDARLMFFEETPENQLTAEARLRLFEEIEKAKITMDLVRCTLYLGCNLPTVKQLNEVVVLLREDSQMNNFPSEEWRLWICDCGVAKKAALLSRVFPWHSHALALPCGESPLSTIRVYPDRTYHGCTCERLSQIEVLKKAKTKSQFKGRRRFSVY